MLLDYFARIADDQNFGNARDARRLFEGVRKAQSQRLRLLGRMPDMAELRTLSAADVAAVTAATGSARPTCPATVCSVRVLVVEDDENLRIAITGSLRAAGFAVDAVGDLPAADEALAVNSYDCAVFDRMLPSGDSLAYVRARRPSVPVLFLTARDAVADRIAGLDARRRLPGEAVRRRGARGAGAAAVPAGGDRAGRRCCAAATSRWTAAGTRCAGPASC